MTIVSSTEQKHGGTYMGETGFPVYIFSGIFQTETIDFLLLISSGKVRRHIYRKQIAMH